MAEPLTTPSTSTKALRWIIGVPAGLFAVVFFAALINVLSGNATRGAREAVAYQLRDPASAQFREVFTHQGNVCGQVNGKNGFGAYTGFKRFYVADGKVEMEPERGPSVSPGLPGDADLFDLGWRINCGSPG